MKAARLSFASILAAALFAAGCQTTDLKAPPPADFAAFKGKSMEAGVTTRAVSATGVVYRVRTVPHEPKADLAFWKEALARKLKDDGYLVLGTEEVTVGSRPGAAIHAVAPLTNGDYGFLVAFAPAGDRLVIAESAGTEAELAKAKPAVLQAVAAIALEPGP